MARPDSNPNFYTWTEPAAILKHSRLMCSCLCGLAAALSIICGIVRSGVSVNAWVGFFGTAALVALMVEAIGVIRFDWAPETMDHAGFIGVHRFLNWGSLLHGLAMLGAAIAGMISCVKNGVGLPDVLVILGFLLASAASWGLRGIYMRLRISEIKP